MYIDVVLLRPLIALSPGILIGVMELWPELAHRGFWHGLPH